MIITAVTRVPYPVGKTTFPPAKRAPHWPYVPACISISGHLLQLFGTITETSKRPSDHTKCYFFTEKTSITFESKDHSIHMVWLFLPGATLRAHICPLTSIDIPRSSMPFSTYTGTTEQMHLTPISYNPRVHPTPMRVRTCFAQLHLPDLPTRVLPRFWNSDPCYPD